MKETISVYHTGFTHCQFQFEIPKNIGLDQNRNPKLLSQRNRELVKSMTEDGGVSIYKLDRQTGATTSAFIASYLFAKYLLVGL